MPELELSMDIVCRVIDKAREFHSKESVVIPEDVNDASEEDLLQVLADHENDLTYTCVGVVLGFKQWLYGHLIALLTKCLVIWNDHIPRHFVCEAR